MIRLPIRGEQVRRGAHIGGLLAAGKVNLRGQQFAPIRRKYLDVDMGRATGVQSRLDCLQRVETVVIGDHVPAQRVARIVVSAKRVGLPEVYFGLR